MSKPTQKPWYHRLACSVRSRMFDRLIITKNDLYRALNRAKNRNIISNSSWDLINSVIQIANMQVRDVMTPTSKIVKIDINTPVPVVLAIMSDSAHSRFPVFDGDQLKGILLAKDLFTHFVLRPDSPINISEYLRPHITVSESKSLESLLKEFQSNKSHLALAIDEFSNISGLLTIEDVIEQIVGEIEDEHDIEEDNITDYGQGRFLVSASTQIEEFNTFFNTDFSTKNNKTIAGILLLKFEKMPKQLEVITLNDIEFKVLKSDDRRLYLLEVSPANPPNNTA